jgi:hypothetical protein
MMGNMGLFKIPKKKVLEVIEDNNLKNNYRSNF